MDWREDIRTHGRGGEEEMVEGGRGVPQMKCIYSWNFSCSFFGVISIQ